MHLIHYFEGRWVRLQLQDPPLPNFDLDFDLMALISLDEPKWRAAADIAEELGVRSLDAIHLACAQKLNINPLTFVTFDIRQAQAARRMGFTVVGA